MRPRYRTIVNLALPIMAAMASQNVMNLVDTGMVGTLGDTALAAVGLGGIATLVAQAFVQGLGMGVQATAARRYGEGAHRVLAVPLNGGLIVALGVAVPVSVALFLLAPWLYRMLSSDLAVGEQGVPYFQARVVAIAAVGLNYAFRGYFNGINQPRIYLHTLLVMHGCNIVLNYVLIFGKLGLPPLGVFGAGLGTAIATHIGTVIYVVLAIRQARGAGFLRVVPTWRTIRTLMWVSVPSGLRRLFFTAGLTILFAIVGRVGTAELAAANVLVNIMLVAILPSIGLGLTAASLVGQALGRGDRPDATQWGWDVAKLAVAFLVLVGLPMLLVPEWILSVFIHEPVTLQLARLPLQIVGATIFFDGIGLVLQNAAAGAGDTRRVMIVSVGLQWGLLLPAAWLVGPSLTFGLLGIWIAMAVHRALQAACFALLWRRGRWARARV